MEVPKTHLMCKQMDGETRLAVSYSQIETFLQCPQKWYFTYVDGMRSTDKQEATSYGTVVHQTAEYFFKNRCLPTLQEVSEASQYYWDIEEIPFSDPEEMARAGKELMQFYSWLVGLFKSPDGNESLIPEGSLNQFEKMLRHGRILGVEEDFKLPYRLPEPIDINGILHTHVYIVGSVDLHLGFKKDDKIYHYVIDWKSGKKIFDQNKLNTNLQHPIYSMYIYRKYGDGFPAMCTYLFTRTREYQKVQVDQERVNRSVIILNDTFRKMYDFENEKVTTYKAHVKAGDRWVMKNATMKAPTAENQKPCPSALCAFCDFGKQKKNICPYSSEWDISQKKKT